MMRMIILTVLTGWFSLNLSAQTTEKEKRSAEWKLEKEKILTMAKNRAFVLEANRHINRYQYQRPLASDNYIAVLGDEVIIQTSDPNRVGFNGIGGVTAEGKILEYKIVQGKAKHPVTVHVDFSNAALGMGSLTFTLNGSDHATVKLTDNWGNRNSWAGTLTEAEEYEGYTGMAIQ